MRLCKEYADKINVNFNFKDVSNYCNDSLKIFEKTGYQGTNLYLKQILEKRTILWYCSKWHNHHSGENSKGESEENNSDTDIDFIVSKL